jgi:hypothetical protein
MRKVYLYSIALLLAVAVVCPAATNITLGFDSLPSAQGWTYASGCAPNALPEGSVFSLANGFLRLNTAARGTSFVSGFYELSSLTGIDPSASFIFEARVRVLAVDPPPPSTAQVFSLNATLGGVLYLLQVGDGEVRTFDPPSPGIAVDTTIFHTYSIVKQAGATTYAVLVDGVPVLTQNTIPEGGGDDVVFGDGSCFSRNGIAEISSVRFSQPYGVCPLYDPTKAVHSGATIPIKLQLCDGSGNDLSSSSITVHAVSITQVSNSISGAVEDSGNANPDYDFRFDSSLGTTGGYIFNLKTTGLTTGTYNLNFTVTGDSFTYTAPFQVK